MSSNILDDQLRQNLKPKVRISNIERVEKVTSLLVGITLLIDLGVCYASSEYFLFFLMAVLLGGGTLYSIALWKKETHLFDKSYLKQVLYLQKSTQKIRWTIIGFILLKLVVLIFWGRVFYFSLQTGFSISRFPLWQIILPAMSLLIIIVLSYYIYITKKIEINSQKNGRK